jgi:hypothetical protein
MLTPTLKLALTPVRELRIRPLVAMGHKITTVPLILKIWEIIFCFWANYSKIIIIIIFCFGQITQK